MTVEAQNSPGYNPTEPEILDTFLLMTLEAHDSLCLDNQPEREALAKDLATALVTAANDGTLELARLLEPPQQAKFMVLGLQKHIEQLLDNSLKNEKLVI